MQLGLGCVSLGSTAGRREADDIRLVHTAIDLGITVFDSADAYGAGASEYVLGRAVKRQRDRVVLATKGGFAFRPRHRAEQWARRWSKPVVERARRRAPVPLETSGPATYAQQDFSARHLRDAVHASLRRLGTDRIDLYQLHGPTEVFPDLLDQLSDLVTAGDVVRFGVGASSVADADNWLAQPGVSVVQVPFGILDPEAASTTFLLAREHHREIWARGVFGGGVLALADRDPSALRSHPKWELVQTLRRIAAEAGLDQYQLAFGFVLGYRRDVSALLVGSESVDHLRRNTELLAAPPLAQDVFGAALAAARSLAPDSP